MFTILPDIEPVVVDVLMLLGFWWAVNSLIRQVKSLKIIYCGYDLVSIAIAYSKEASSRPFWKILCNRRAL